MAASLDQKQVEELLAKYRALAEKGQRRIDELEQRNEHLVGEILSSLIVPTSAFGLSYARAYFGESSSIFGIPIDAAVGMLFKGLATLLGFSSVKEAQVAAKVAHDVANGALASWSATAGAALGMKKRMEKPVPAPQPNTGAQEMPPVSSTAVTREDLAAIAVATALHTQPAMPGPVPPPTMPQWPNIAAGAHVAATSNAPAMPAATQNTPRRSLAAARTVGLAEAVSAAWPQVAPQPNAMELSTQFAQESRSVQISQEEPEAAAGWRLFIAEQARREQRSS
jgi:hypothetical protein